MSETSDKVLPWKEKFKIVDGALPIDNLATLPDQIKALIKFAENPGLKPDSNPHDYNDLVEMLNAVQNTFISAFDPKKEKDGAKEEKKEKEKEPKAKTPASFIGVRLEIMDPDKGLLRGIKIGEISPKIAPRIKQLIAHLESIIAKPAKPTSRPNVFEGAPLPSKKSLRTFHALPTERVIGYVDFGVYPLLETLLPKLADGAVADSASPEAQELFRVFNKKLEYLGESIKAIFLRREKLIQEDKDLLVFYLEQIKKYFKSGGINPTLVSKMLLKEVLGKNLEDAKARAKAAAEKRRSEKTHGSESSGAETREGGDVPKKPELESEIADKLNAINSSADALSGEVTGFAARAKEYAAQAKAVHPKARDGSSDDDARIADQLLKLANESAYKAKRNESNAKGFVGYAKSLLQQITDGDVTGEEIAPTIEEAKQEMIKAERAKAEAQDALIKAFKSSTRLIIAANKKDAVVVQKRAVEIMQIAANAMKGDDGIDFIANQVEAYTPPEGKEIAAQIRALAKQANDEDVKSLNKNAQAAFDKAKKALKILNEAEKALKEVKGDTEIKAIEAQIKQFKTELADAKTDLAAAEQNLADLLEKRRQILELRKQFMDEVQQKANQDVAAIKAASDPTEGKAAEAEKLAVDAEKDAAHASVAFSSPEMADIVRAIQAKSDETRIHADAVNFAAKDLAEKKVVQDVEKHLGTINNAIPVVNTSKDPKAVQDQFEQLVDAANKIAVVLATVKLEVDSSYDSTKKAHKATKALYDEAARINALLIQIPPEETRTSEIGASLSPIKDAIEESLHGDDGMETILDIIDPKGRDELYRSPKVEALVSHIKALVLAGKLDEPKAEELLEQAKKLNDKAVSELKQAREAFDKLGNAVLDGETEDNILALKRKVHDHVANANRFNDEAIKLRAQALAIQHRLVKDQAQVINLRNKLMDELLDVATLQVNELDLVANSVDGMSVGARAKFTEAQSRFRDPLVQAHIGNIGKLSGEIDSEAKLSREGAVAYKSGLNLKPLDSMKDDREDIKTATTSTEANTILVHFLGKAEELRAELVGHMADPERKAVLDSAGKAGAACVEVDKSYHAAMTGQAAVDAANARAAAAAAQAAQQRQAAQQPRPGGDYIDQMLRRRGLRQ